MLSDCFSSCFRFIKRVDEVLVVKDVMNVSLHTADDMLLDFLEVLDLLIHLLHVFIVHLLQVFSLVSHYLAE